jgi:hypothetical protein
LILDTGYFILKREKRNTQKKTVGYYIMVSLTETRRGSQRKQ